MVYVFSSLIKIGEIQLTFAADVYIKSTWREMTDTATIHIPKKVLVKGKDLKTQPIADVIKTGMPVVIQLGYNGNLRTEFVGFVSRSPKPVIPIEIECEDEMFKLKRMRVKQKVFASGTIRDVIKYIAPGYEVDAEILDSSVGTNYSCTDEAESTAALALKRIEDVFGLKSFFRLVPDASQPYGVKQILVIGRPYSSSDLQTLAPVKYQLRSNTKRDSLQYKFKEDYPVQIKGIMKIDNGKDLKYDYPPDVLDDSSVITLHYSPSDKETLERLVNADWLRRSIDRYEGDVVGFGIPYTRHGMVVNIIDNFYEGRNNMNFIDSVEIRADMNGFERQNKIGYTVNSTTKEAIK